MPSGTANLPVPTPISSPRPSIGTNGRRASNSETYTAACSTNQAS